MNYSIQKVGVIGAGIMGSGIAGLIAGAGLPVVLLDVVPKELSEEELKRGIRKEDPSHLNRLAQEGKNRLCDKKTGTILTAAMADYITVGNLETSLSLLEDCDWIIEVVAENLRIKQEVFQKLEPHIGPKTILSTNTSGIPVGEIAKGMSPALQQRFLGSHFFNPPRYMRLLEIIPTPWSDPAMVEDLAEFGRNVLGKGVIIAKDTPNFIGNRMGSLITPLVCRLMDKYGFDIETVDALTGELIGRPRSASFKTVDMVGLDILLHVNDNLIHVLKKEEEKALFALPPWVQDMAENRQLGNKTGGGFYKRQTDEKGNRQTLVWNPQQKAYVPCVKPEPSFVQQAKKIRRLKDRLQFLLYEDVPESNFLWDNLSQILLYAAWKSPEIANSYKDIDLALRWGYNWQVGPFEIWDLIGFEKAAQRLQDQGDSLPPWIQERLKEKINFYEKDPDQTTFDTVYSVLQRMGHSTLLDMGDGVLGLEIHSPGSSITAKIRQEVVQTLDLLEQTPAYRGLVLLGSGPHFLTGADLKEMVMALFMEQYDEIEKTVAQFQGISLRLKYAKKPVVAAVHGMVLGGGLEFALHCSRIIAHTDTYMGFVEPGVGLLPAGGGLKEMLLRGMQDVSAYDYKDPAPMLQKLFTNAAMGKVSTNAFQALEMGYLRSSDRIVPQIDSLAARAKEEVLLLSQDGYRQKLPATTAVSGTSGMAALQAILQAMVEGRMISPYDAVIAGAIARVFTGGDVPNGTVLTEEELLRLEREGFVMLIQNAKTHERITAMVETRRPLRN